LSDRDNITLDRAPAVSYGSWVFALAASMFLVALFVSGFSMVTDGEPAMMSKEVARGRALFNGEGCMECHSRMVRIGDRGMGPIADNALFINETLMPGSSRIGPDIQNVAGKYPRSLLITRLTDPRVIQPGTLMPSYAHLGPADMEALIEFLETPPSQAFTFESIRSMNGIEAAVPDEILIGLKEYIDLDSGLFISPLTGTLGELIIGRGIYNSRCAACHGISGDGKGAISGRESRSVPSVQPSDFGSGEKSDYSPVMWYWRISEGIAGTDMPRWKKYISEDGLWFLVGYVTALSKGIQPDFPQTIYDEWIQVFGEDIEVDEMNGSVVQDEWIFLPIDTTESAVVDSIEENAEVASEEEGESEAPDGVDGAENGGEEPAATDSAEISNTEEDSP